MEKTQITSKSRKSFLSWKKMTGLMKLTALLMFCCISSFSLSVNAQQVSVTIRNGKVETVLNTISKQTGYSLAYSAQVVDLNRMVSLNMENKSLDDVLEALFMNTDIKHEVKNGKIYLFKGVAPIEQGQDRLIEGIVLDAAGVPVVGANVMVKGTKNGTITDVDGKFSLNAEKGSVLVFSFIGFADEEIVVGNQQNLSVVLKDDANFLDELVVVGYGTQKKVTLTGAVSNIKSEDILKTKNENVENMLTGKIAGVRVVQKSSEPGEFNNSFDIRGLGEALVIIDGVPRENMNRLDPNDIESLSVLKDASAAIYGVRAANGVVLITTKKGKAGKVEMNYSGNFGLQNPSGSPKSLTAQDWMVLRNERAMRNINGGLPLFSEEEIDKYRKGELKGTDWWAACMRPLAPQTQHNLSISGGNEKVNYFVSGGYSYQESFLKSNSLDYNKFNVRSNVTGQINDHLKVSVNLSTIIEEKNAPFERPDWIIRAFQRIPSTQSIYANDNPDYLQHGWIGGANPVAMMDADQVGSKHYNNKWFQASADIQYDFPWIEGLSAKGMFSYDYRISDDKTYQKTYQLYNYDGATETYNPITLGGVNKILREYYSKHSMLYQVSLNYSHQFAEKHNVNALVLLEGSKKQGDNFYANRELSILLDQLFAGNSLNQEGNMYIDSGALYRQANMGLVGKFAYDYKSKYLAEFSFRYDGSSKFGTGSQWGFFPAGFLGWRISEEDFWKDSPLSFINNFKIRGSYGKMGDDRASSYQFVNGYEYPSGGFYSQPTEGSVFDGVFVTGAKNKGLVNPLITWYVSKTYDIGLDMEAWKGKLGFTFDYFHRKRDGLLTTRNLSLPGVVGADLPQENLNSDMTHGFDIEVLHRNTVGDFSYSIKGIYSFTRNMRGYRERGRSGNSYENWRQNTNDRVDGIKWGYQGDGIFDDWNEIYNSDTFISIGTLPGDYKYEDWNGDGMISGLDVHPIGYSGRPLINFSLDFGMEYKGFDLNLLFQGAAMKFVEYKEQLREPMWGDPMSNGLAFFFDRWHPADPAADPYHPATEWVKGEYAYGKHLANAESTFNFYDSKYVRLKNIELGYTFPTRWMNRAGIKNLRLYINAYNLFTLDGVKIDPEHPDDANGNLYPLNRTFSIGANMKF